MTDAPARTTSPGTPYRIAVVCLGNICRSPMADVVLTDRIARAGLAGRVEVASAGTGGWHLDEPMDPRAAGLLTRHGYDPSAHRVRKFESHWFDDVDLVLAMDSTNYAAVTELGPAAKVRMFRDFDPLANRDGDRDVPDPYFGGDDGFEHVLEIIERTADRIVAAVRRAATAPGG